MVFLAFLQQTQTNALMGLLPMVLIFAIFYLLLFMPMQKQKKQQRQMLEGLQSGNVVQTTGGIVGTIISRNDENDTLVLRVKPDNIKIEIVRSAVSALMSEK